MARTSSLTDSVRAIDATQAPGHAMWGVADARLDPVAGVGLPSAP